MEEVILVIHLILALSIIGLVLIQRSEGGGGLGIGSGGGGLGRMASPQGTANALTKATAICAGAFFCTSLILAVLAGRHNQANQGILQALEETPAPMTGEAPAETPAVPTDKPPATPSAPTAE